MSLENYGLTAMSIVGVALLVVGQYMYWLPAGTLSCDIPQMTEPDFVIRETKFERVPGAMNDEQHLRVLLVNRLDQPVTLLGARNGCSRWACYEALNLPKVVPAGGEFELEINVAWKGAPEEALELRLFTNLSLTGVVNLELLPDSVTIGPVSPMQEFSLPSQ